MVNIFQSASDIARNLFAKLQAQQAPIHAKTNGAISTQVIPRIVNTPIPTKSVPFIGPAIGGFQQMRNPTQTPTFTPKQAFNNVVAPVWQVPLRTAFQLKQTPVLQGLFPGQNLPANPITPTGFGRVAFGNEPLVNYQARYKQGFQLPFTSKTVKGPLSLPLFAGGIAADLATGGEGKIAVKGGKAALTDLRSARPGSFSNVRTADNPLLLGKNWKGKSPSLIEKPPENVPPGEPPFVNGTAAINPKDVAGQARLASFGARQAFEVRGGNLAQEMDSILKNPKDNLNIRLAVENPSKIDAYAQKASDPEAFAQLAHKISGFYDYALGSLKGQKVSLGEVNNYFTHVWDLSTPEARATFDDLMAKNAKNFSSGFTKERVVNSIKQGLDAGLTLKNEKASNDILAYTKSMGKQLSASAFNNKINELRPGGAVPFSAQGTVPYNYKGQLFEQSNHPGNKGTFIDPEIQAHMNYYNKSAFADNPVIKVADKVNTGIKELKLAGGLFHGLRESVNYAGQQLMSGHLPDLAGGAHAFIDPRFARNQMDHFINNGTLDAASKMGIDISSAGGIGNEETNVMELLQSKDEIKKATFQRLIPYYIMKTVANLPETSRTPQVGKQIMALYNGLTNEVAGTNRTTSQVARFAFLAPQFNLGKIINVLSAFKPEITPQANFARQALVGTAIATAIEYQIANFVANQKIDMNPASILSNGVLHPSIPLPYKSPTGKGLSTDLPASNVADLYKSGIGSLGKAGIDALLKNGKAGDDLTQAGTDASHTVTARTSALFSLINQLTTGKDYYGNDVNLSTLAQSQLPIPVVQLLKTVQNKPGTKTPSQDYRTAILNTAGLRVHNDPNDPLVKAQTAFFAGIDKAASTLNQNDKNTFLGLIHPTTKDANGNAIVDKNVYTTPAKYDVLLGNKNLLTAEQAFQQAQTSHDPMWDLSPSQLQAFLHAQVISKNDPTAYLGTNDKTVSLLYQQLPKDFFTKRQAFFDSLKAQGAITSGTNPTAQMPSDVSNFLSKIQTVSSTKVKTLAWQTPLGIRAKAFLTQSAAQTNQKRVAMGLPAIDPNAGSTLADKAAVTLADPNVPVATKQALVKSLSKNPAFLKGVLKQAAIHQAAQKVLTGLKANSSPEQRKALLQQYASSGVLTKAVVKEIQSLQQSQTILGQ